MRVYDIYVGKELEYGVVAWGSCFACILNDLHTVLNYCLYSLLHYVDHTIDCCTGQACGTLLLHVVDLSTQAILKPVVLSSDSGVTIIH